MKSFLKMFLLCVVICLSLTNCLKNKDNNPAPPLWNLTKTSYNNGTDIITTFYIYNSNKKKVKTSTTKNGKFIYNDTVFYNKTTGNFDSILRYYKYDSLNYLVLNETYVYTFADSLLQTIIKRGKYNKSSYKKTYTFTHTGNHISSLTISGDPAGNNSKYTNISYLNNDIVSFNYDPTGTGKVINLSTAQVDAYSNINNFKLPIPDNLIESFSNNNLVEVTVTNPSNVILDSGDTIKPGSDFIQNTFVYDYFLGVVLTKKITPTKFNGLKQSAISTYTFNSF